MSSEKTLQVSEYVMILKKSKRKILKKCCETGLFAIIVYLKNHLIKDLKKSEVRIF